jgi:hypothetical protein
MSIEEIIKFKEKNKNDHLAIHTNFYGYSINYNGYGKSMRVKHIDDILLAKEKHDSFLEIVKKDNPKIITSHICPDKNGLFNIYENNNKIENDKENIFNYIDTSNFNDYIENKIWVYGHTHKKTNFYSRGCNFISNPLGYPHEKLKNKILKYNLN